MSPRPPAEHFDRRARLRHGTLLLASVLVLALWPASSLQPFSGAWSQVPDDLLRVEGEFGLAVHMDQDSVHVRWLTRNPGPGFLEVQAAGEVVQSVFSEPWVSHHHAFPHPRIAHPEIDSFLLRYGGTDDPEDRHETRIHLDIEERTPPVLIEDVDSLYVMADIHGEYDTMLSVLDNAGLIDSDLQWAGGNAHLAILGDHMSRGPDVSAVLWYLYRLEREAEAAGGRIHMTLGNHEIMVMLDDLRYVHYKEDWIAETHGLEYDRMFDPRRSVLGRWLASKPAVIKVNDALMTHGGVSRKYLDHSLESLRDTLTSFMAEDLFYHWADTTQQFVITEEAFQRRFDFFWAPESTFWYRGYAQSDTLGEELSAVLDHFDARVHIVGHTPVETVRKAYDGRFIMVNVIPFASEALLRTRTKDGHDHVRVRETGPPVPLDGRPPIDADSDTVVDPSSGGNEPP